MNTFNIAIAGCGAIHSVHADAILNTPCTRLYAVVDINETRAKETSVKYGCRYYTGFMDMLKDENIHAVHICTPHYLHASMAIAAMEHGKHVLVEKPMAISPGDALKMIEKSESTGMKLGICYQNRYNATSQKMKEFLDSGESGKILGARAFVTWHRDQSYYAGAQWRGTWDKEGGGVLINQSIHTLDLLQWFLGDVSRLKASIDTRLLKDIIEAEDTAEAAITFKNGATALFYATNCYCTDSPVFIELVCENALIRLEGDLIITHKNGVAEHFAETDTATGNKAYWGCSHKVLIKDFYSKLADGEYFGIDGSQGIKSIKILDAIYASHKNKAYMDL